MSFRARDVVVVPCSQEVPLYTPADLWTRIMIPLAVATYLCDPRGGLHLDNRANNNHPLF